MSGNNREMVSAEHGVRLIGPGYVIVPLTAEWHYSRQDPYAVRMSLDAGTGEPVVWVLSRDLLAAALRAPAGIGDVRAWPSAASIAPADDGTMDDGTMDDGADTGERVLNIRLGPPDGYARFEADAAEIEAFLSRTFELVPAGAESDCLDLDAWLAELLSQA